jgi:hypothetical protein
MSDNGVDVTRLEPKTELVINTKTCIYDITIVDPEAGEITISGGPLFTSITTAFIESSCGQEGNKPKWIGKNMSIVLRYKLAKQRKFRTHETDTVDSVNIIPPTAKWQYEVE